ncbi:hypothetical protein [Nisaea nitritireducens]|jgi:hypothetical protein|uniref:hypothetical protein n=1 Tax=Nisaea nitritireducens TaxID=568392 RepID=UPI0018662C8A|nr:hypothetical protein [Nisaea nitritireducens]
MTGTIERTMKINVLPSVRESREQHYENLNRAGRERTGSILNADWTGQHGDMWEINESIYHEFLGVLPPLAWRDGSFCVFDLLQYRIFAILQYRMRGRYGVVNQVSEREGQGGISLITR